MATLENLEDWLIAIAQHTRETKEAVQGRAGAKSPVPDERTSLDKIRKAVEDGLTTGLRNGLGQARSLATRGFGGTTEQAANSYAMEMLGKQFAAVMKPIMDGATYLAFQLERRMKMMGGSEQNRLMGGIVGAGLGYQLGGGARGMIGGGLLGMGIMGDSPTMGMIGGAILGARFGPVGAAVGGIGGALASGRYGDQYEMYKKETARDLGGNSVVSRGAAGLAAAGATMFDAFTGGEMSKYLVSVGRLKPKPGDEPRRDVTPFQAEMGEAGSTSMRIQEAVIRSTAGAGFEENGPLKPVIDIGLAILDQLIRLGGGTPPPRSATDALPGGGGATTV